MKTNIGATDFGRDIISRKNGSIEYWFEGEHAIAIFDEIQRPQLDRGCNGIDKRAVCRGRTHYAP